MLVLCVVGAALAIWNPYSLLFVLPSMHAWLWLPHVLDRPAAARALVYAVGFVPVVGVFVSFALRYDLGFDAPWYVATLFSVGYTLARALRHAAGLGGGRRPGGRARVRPLCAVSGAWQQRRA